MRCPHTQSEEAPSGERLRGKARHDCEPCRSASSVRYYKKSAIQIYLPSYLLVSFWLHVKYLYIVSYHIVMIMTTRSIKLQMCPAYLLSRRSRLHATDVSICGSVCLSPNCKNAIFSKTKQFRAMVSIDDL